MNHDLENLCSLLYTNSLTEGENKTKLPYLSIYFATKRQVQMPQIENFYIYTVLDGSIRLFTPSGIMDYMPGQLSVSKIDTPACGNVLTFGKKVVF